MKPFFDTNVLVYAFTDGDLRQERALELLTSGGTISVQCLNEFAAVARRKLAMPWKDIAAARSHVSLLCGPVNPLTDDTHVVGIALAEHYKLSVYDSMIAAAALEADCDTLYSEDMHDGLVIDGRLRIVNPFV